MKLFLNVPSFFKYFFVELKIFVKFCETFYQRKFDKTFIKKKIWEKKHSKTLFSKIWVSVSQKKKIIIKK